MMVAQYKNKENSSKTENYNIEGKKAIQNNIGVVMLKSTNAIDTSNKYPIHPDLHRSAVNYFIFNLFNFIGRAKPITNLSINHREK